MTRKDRETLDKLVTSRAKPPKRQHLKNAFLPGTLEIRFLSDMEIGGQGFVDPEAMIVDHSGRCWIVLTSPYEIESFPECLLVTKGEDGFFVDVHVVWDYWRWAKSVVSSDTYAEDEENYAPVLKIVGIPERERNTAAS